MVKFEPLGKDYPERETLEEAKEDVDSNKNPIAYFGLVYETTAGKFVGLNEHASINWREEERQWKLVAWRNLKNQSEAWTEIKKSQETVPCFFKR